jgi:hypothetical protein
MTCRGLFCVALLLAGPALPQSSTEQSASPQAAQPGSSASSTNSSSDILEQIRMECAAAWYARTLIGQHTCIAGRVYGISDHHGDAEISLCPPDRECAFRGIVDKTDRDAVGDLSAFRGKIIAITGDIAKDHDKPRIFITQREQIKVAPGNVTEFDAAHHKPRGKVKHEKIPPPHKW